MSVMPLNNIIVLPGAKLWLQSNSYKELTGKAPVAGERVTLLMQKDEQPRRALSAESFHPIGLAGTVTGINAGGFVCVEAQNRLNIEEIALLRDGSFSMTVSRRADIDDLDPAEADRRLTGVKDRILSFSRGKPWEEALRGFAAHWDSLWTVGAAMSPYLSLSTDERYALLCDQFGYDSLAYSVSWYDPDFKYLDGNGYPYGYNYNTY